LPTKPPFLRRYKLYSQVHEYINFVMRSREHWLLHSQCPTRRHNTNFQGYGRVFINDLQEGLGVTFKCTIDIRNRLAHGRFQFQSLIIPAGWTPGTGFLIAFRLGLRGKICVGHDQISFIHICGIIMPLTHKVQYNQ